MLRFWFGTALWKRVLVAMVLGVAVGLFVGEGIVAIKWMGDLFIRAIKMLVVPLIFFSLVNGVVSIGDINKLGRVGGRAMTMFISTSIIAVTTGITLGLVFTPGLGLDFTMPAGTDVPAPPDQTLVEMMISMVPDNPIAAMAEGQILQLIIFALLFGIALLVSGEEGKPLVRGVEAGASVMLKLTMIVMELTPFGVFALMAWVAGTFGWEALLPLAKIVALNYAGCFVMILLVYPALVRFVAKLNIVDFYRGIFDAQAVAFSTASSNATIPVTLRCTQDNLGVSKSVSSFVVSLGATINMDGTAMYLGLVAIFGAQLFGIDLNFFSYLMIALTATLGSIGVAGVPGAGLVMLGLVLSSVGVPLETIAFVAGINHIMDMMRTATNVTGDSAITVTTAKLSNEIDIAEYESDIDV
ncbi:cation:dicarboxylase symporter family transporter [Altererythrobacter oceanensis]|uniref:Cation:dicarboxylase symporter family transporter n=2 Tax=Qipengyuania oceanensis TaxID=1463597 RepID=A0A844YH59_9SPHN|nr:dicarboxylate/amino acid:cation symporter [Qipengyuania oceanensis]MXO62679.1 cation:dicarboxylase symporter family transporter [Qipengyuania oceanensis]